MEGPSTLPYSTSMEGPSTLPYSTSMEGPSTLPYSRRSSMHEERKPLLLTGYRILVIFLTTSFGLSKARLSYQGYNTSPNTLDWMYGVFVFLVLYWLDIYERHARGNKIWTRLMYEVDYIVVFWRLLKRMVGSEQAGHGHGVRLD